MTVEHRGFDMDTLDHVLQSTSQLRLPDTVAFDDSSRNLQSSRI